MSENFRKVNQKEENIINLYFNFISQSRDKKQFMEEENRRKSLVFQRESIKINNSKFIPEMEDENDLENNVNHHFILLNSYKLFPLHVSSTIIYI